MITLNSITMLFFLKKYFNNSHYSSEKYFWKPDILGFFFLFSLSVVDISYFLQTKNLIWMKIYTVPQMGIGLGFKYLCVEGPDGAGTVKA